jgi:4-hydroxy-tetrahydrodipicolinate reductase
MSAGSAPAPLIIHGAAGRMGQRLIALAGEVAELKLVAAVEAASSPLLGRDAGELAGIGTLGVKVDAAWPAAAPEPAPSPVAIDFSVPAGTRAALAACRDARCALVVGTTGLTEDDHRALDTAAADIPVLQAANMSLGVNLLLALVGQVAAKLGDDYDIEIVEAHHRFKQDAPSGTALALAEAICAATGKTIADDTVHGRCGPATQRRRGEIGMHAMRLGDVVGRHTFHYAALGEEIQIGHIASTRDVFARGALRAAAWLAGRPAGRYTMRDVLGL